MIGVKFLQKSMKTQVISPSDPDWQECLNNMPHDFYHLPGYLDLESKRYSATAEAIIIKDEEEVFFLPYIIRDYCQLVDSDKFGHDRIYDVISPYGYPGMLVSQAGQNHRFVDKCLEIIYTYWQEKNICSAFLRLHPILNSYIDSSNGDCHRTITSCELPQQRLRHRGEVVVCDLTEDLEEIWKQFRANHRTKINKLRRSGYVVKMGSVDKYLDIFINIYIETMNRVNATNSYFFSRDYFYQLFQALGDRLNICVVEIAGEIVAASLITEFSGIVQYHLGGTRTEFLPQSPTTIMFDYIIKWAKERNNQYLNLGGGLSGNHDSLYHFKSGFSNRTKSFVTLETIVNQGLYDHLTNIRAESLGLMTSEITDTSFFPAYRAC
jgi:hypothetical protein